MILPSELLLWTLSSARASQSALVLKPNPPVAAYMLQSTTDTLEPYHTYASPPTSPSPKELFWPRGPEDESQLLAPVSSGPLKAATAQMAS